jgi:hypothetical protein
MVRIQLHKIDASIFGDHIAQFVATLRYAVVEVRILDSPFI